MNILRTFSAARREWPRLAPLMRDARVPRWAKILTVLGALFIISPLNVLGDVPLLGFLDDAALLVFLVHTFVRFAERRVAREVPAPMRRVSPGAIAVGAERY